MVHLSSASPVDSSLQLCILAHASHWPAESWGLKLFLPLLYTECSPTLMTPPIMSCIVTANSSVSKDCYYAKGYTGLDTPYRILDWKGSTRQIHQSFFRWKKTPRIWLATVKLHFELMSGSCLYSVCQSNCEWLDIARADAKSQSVCSLTDSVDHLAKSPADIEHWNSPCHLLTSNTDISNRQN